MILHVRGVVWRHPIVIPLTQLYARSFQVLHHHLPLLWRVLMRKCGLYSRSINLSNNTGVELQADLLLNCAELLGNVLIVSVLRRGYHGHILDYLGFHTLPLNLEASMSKLM